MELSDYIEKFNAALLNTSISRCLAPLDNIFTEKTRVGLDVGTYSVKLVEVTDTVKGSSLVSLGHVPIAHASGLSEDEKKRNMVQALGDLVHQSKLKTRHVSLIISDPNIYLRHINIPVVPEDELVRAIRWQAEKYIPFAIEEAIVDFQMLASKMKGSENQMEIVIVAVQRRIIENYMSLIKEVKLIPMVIDVAPFAIAKAFRHNYQIDTDEIVPLIDIGAHNTAMVVLKKGSVQLVRNFNIAGQHLTDAIAKDRNLTRDKAEEMKRSFSWGHSALEAADDTSIAPLLEPVLLEWVEQVNRSLAYCEKELIQEKIQQVFICGGSANMTGLHKILSEKLRLTVKVADPFKKVNVPQRIIRTPGILKIAPTYMAALGAVV